MRDYSEPGLFSGCSAFLEIGLHAMAGTVHAFLDHTQSSKNWFRYSINGRAHGELAQEAAYCGAYGVPVVMVSGDDAACQEARALIEGIECAAVKTASGRYCAQCLPAEQAEARIREAARRGIEKAGRIRPFTPNLPAEIQVEFCYTHLCDEAMAHNPHLRRVDGRTVAKTIAKIETFADLLP